MEISKKDIECKEIVDKIERLTSSIRRFIQLVNKNIPIGSRLKREYFIIQKDYDALNFLNDGNTRCAGFDYKVFWTYTSADVIATKENIINLQQSGSITFVLECGERCYDHRQNSGYFFSLYHKGERIDYINENYDENHLFKPYEIMQAVWRIREELEINNNNISEDCKLFAKFAKNFEKELNFTIDEESSNLNKDLPEEVLKKIEEFKIQSNRFAIIANCYCAVASNKVSEKDLKLFLYENEYTAIFMKSIEEFCSKSIFHWHFYEYLPKTFWLQKDSHHTLDENERNNSFHLWDCLKCTLGYSYYNTYMSLKGISENWYPRVLYFSYYTSKDFQESHYTISLTSCEGRFRENYIKVIEANTLEELLSPQNAIEIAKWLEEIWQKTALIYYYNSLISKNKIRNFKATCEID